MMNPVVFVIQGETRHDPTQIAHAILDVDQWSTFGGAWPLPGIQSATFRDGSPTAQIVGSIIDVVNTDGSRHVETVNAWDPPRGFELKLHNFPKPLCWMATHIDERWEFYEHHFARSFEIHPKRVWCKPVLWVISRLLARAVRRHLAQIEATDLPATNA
jgi:hypothetical protein